MGHWVISKYCTTSRWNDYELEVFRYLSNEVADHTVREQVHQVLRAYKSQLFEMECVGGAVFWPIKVY